MIVDANQPAPIQYTDPTYQALLYPLARFYNITTGSPVLEASLELELINNGVYQGQYLFLNNNIYVVQILVYTDDTYTTVDEEFAQQTIEVQCTQFSTDLGAVLAAVNKILQGLPSGLQAQLDPHELSAQLEPGTIELDAKFDCE